MSRFFTTSIVDCLDPDLKFLELCRWNGNLITSNCLLSRKPGSNHSCNDKTRNFTKKALLDFNLLDRINSNACCLDKHVMVKMYFQHEISRKLASLPSQTINYPVDWEPHKMQPPKEKHTCACTAANAFAYLAAAKSMSSFSCMRNPKSGWSSIMDTSFPIFGRKRRLNSEASTLSRYKLETSKSTNLSDGFPLLELILGHLSSVVRIHLGP